MRWSELRVIRDLFTVYAALQNEHDLYLPQLVRFGNINTVTQQHARASEANIQLMQAFGIRPVVLVRNIFDTVVSLLDFFSQGFTLSTFFFGQEFLGFEEQQQVDLLIDFVVPWYFQFVASWRHVERDKRLEVYWLTYEEMVKDKAGVIEQVLSFYGLSAPLSEIQKHIRLAEENGEKNRFNKGIVGRGNVLSTEQKGKIAALARHFPESDFSCLGI